MSPSTHRRLAGRALVALTVVFTLAAVAFAGLPDSSTSTPRLVRAENAVGVIGEHTSPVVGAHEPVLAGQCRARAPGYDRVAVGSCVAPETGGHSFVHVDVGGENDYPNAINVNPATEGHLGPIPNLVQGTAQANPLPDQFGNLVSAENIPIHQAGAVEGIARLVQPGGAVGLVNPADFQPAVAAHGALIDMLPGYATQSIGPEGSLHIHGSTTPDHESF